MSKTYPAEELLIKVIDDLADFRKLWESKETDKMPYIRWDCGITENKKKS